MKILVSIATYGEKNINYLNRVIDEYKSYKKYDIDISVHGTIPINRDDINFIQYENPKNTVFLHRAEFVDKQNDYDYFIFTEDDILIKEHTIDVYIKYDSLLPMNYSLGFLRYEKTPESIDYLIDLWLNLSNYNFIKNDNINIVGYNYFSVTNPHQSSYILSKDKLKYVISNSNYLTTGDDMGLESASSGIFTDWYLNTGVLHKILPLNKIDLEQCFIEHLPGNHCNPPGVNADHITFRNNTITKDLLFENLNL
jgi:hypothetical protein